MTRTLCPLCGKDFGIADVPQPPSLVLGVLGEHFGADCPATAHVSRSRLG